MAQRQRQRLRQGPEGPRLGEGAEEARPLANRLSLSLRRRQIARWRMVSYGVMWCHGRQDIDLSVHRQGSPGDSEACGS
jgi:hypothetical protein